MEISLEDEIADLVIGANGGRSRIRASYLTYVNLQDDKSENEMRPSPFTTVDITLSLACGRAVRNGRKPYLPGHFKGYLINNLLFKHIRNRSAVDSDISTIYVAGFVRGQEQHGVGNLFCIAQSLKCTSRRQKALNFL